MKKNILTKIAKRFLLMNGYFQLQKDAHTSFSQMAEDLIVAQLFEDKKRGFYVDVGAFHPTLYSNTYVFYQKGWRGLNIDAMPRSMELFKKLRPRDINIEVAISNAQKEGQYHISNSGALNTFSKERVRAIKKMHEYLIINKIKIKTVPLSFVLGKYLPKKQNIDFMSIDVEGLDLQVLKSNDWTRYRPKVIIVEALTFNLDEPKKNQVYLFLKKKRYELVAKSDKSLIFKSII